MSSKRGQLYQKIYEQLCGRHPDLHPWHFQWLAARAIYTDLRRVLADQSGQVLDVGCGDGPYRAWMPRAAKIVGADIQPGAAVDILLKANSVWPIESASFDTVLCTQVLEHAEDLALILAEIERVLKPGGTLICTVPFVYNAHGVPHDYRRLSVYGLQQLLAGQYTISEIKGQGGIGSTLGVLLLNWLEQALNHSPATRLLKAGLLPLWLPFCALVNGLAVLLDRADHTAAYYNNVFVVAQKCA